MANLDIIAELLETTANACDSFIKCEMMVNDGEIQESQKYSKNGQILMKALIKDCFKEIEEVIGENIQETNDYDYPNNMELIKALNQISMYLGSYLSASEDLVKNIAIKNLFKAINTAKEIYEALYEN